MHSARYNPMSSLKPTRSSLLKLIPPKSPKFIFKILCNANDDNSVVGINQTGRSCEFGATNCFIQKLENSTSYCVTFYNSKIVGNVSTFIFIFSSNLSQRRRSVHADRRNLSLISIA